MPRVKTKRITDSLPCDLTDEERLKFADDLAEASQAVITAENNKAAAAKQHSYEIGLAKARRDRLANIVASKTEYRDVVVEDTWDWEKDTFTRTRTDTGEVITTRHLNTEEQQLPILDEDEEPSNSDGED